MNLDDLDFALPEELIAQRPAPERDGGRLLVLDRDGALLHRGVRDLPDLLPPSLFVVNDSRVLPARLRGVKSPSGGRVELLLVERLAAEGPNRERWRTMARASKGLPPGQSLRLGDGLEGTVVAPRDEEGLLEVELTAPAGVRGALDRVGAVPLPPYIRREATPEDRERYQTVYAREEGSVAAPTAGLHLSARVLAALDAAGHRRVAVTLHVGPGTFRPVNVDRLEDHHLHEERYHVPPPTAEAIVAAKAEGRPVIAVGTTAVRTLEAAAQEDGVLRAGWGRTDLFLRPGSPFRVVDGLLTNFHLPRSTLLALVMALGGVEAVRGAYTAAVEERYRFYSYGDAMLLRPPR